jgi:long-subunit acyl-CoA synthetase (AMP-forming)
MSSEIALTESDTLALAVPLDALTVPAAFQITARLYRERPALRIHGGDTQLSWAEYRERVEGLARGLAALGIQRGDTVGIQLRNRIEFHLVDMAALHLGAVPFSIYNTSAAEQIRQRLESSGARVMVTEQVFVESVRAGADGALDHLIVVDAAADGALTLSDVVDRGDPAFDLEAAWRAVVPTDVLTLIYTSGSTGPPKAVQLSHRNVLATLRALDPVTPLPRLAMVSIFPMAHILERLLTHYMPLGYGATTTCCPERADVFAALRDVRPDVCAMVPRVWETMREVVTQHLHAADNTESAGELSRLLELSLQRVRASSGGPPADQIAATDRLRERLLPIIGLDRARVAIVGGAACPRSVVEFFRAIGLPLGEAYALTEASGGGGVTPGLLGAPIGTVGRPVPGVELRIADDGEILLRSEMNMVGYRGDLDGTRAAIDSEGWLHTGDLGEQDDNGNLRLLGRKKELIISSYGKNMSPVGIEAAIQEQSKLIGQIVAVGEGRPYNVALVTLDPDAAARFAKARGLENASTAALFSEPVVLAEVESAIARGNETLSRVEQIRAFRLLEDVWQPDSAELTPTMKLKRHAITERYSAEIDDLYGDLTPRSHVQRAGGTRT